MNAARGPRTLTFEDLEAFLGSNSPTPDNDVTLAAYLEHAAVLAAFEPVRLRSLVESGRRHSSDGALDELLRLCEPIAQGGDTGKWSLSLADRRAALARLGSRRAIRHVVSSIGDRPTNSVQRMFEQVIGDDPIDLTRLDREDLAALFPVLDWTTGILDSLPQRSAVQRALTRFDLLAPMHRLADDTFVGRERELEQLADFTFGAQEQAPLFVFGPGGVGKSTLIAQFILSRVAPTGAPFAYIDIDRPTIRPDRPLTFLLDITEQWKSQVEIEPVLVESLTKEIGFALNRFEDSRSFESSVPFGSFISQFVQTFGPVTRSGRPVLVIDTFEEAQFLGPDVVGPAIDFLLQLHRHMPNLVLILSGRTLPQEFLWLAFPGQDMVPLADDYPEAPSRLEQIPLPVRPINLAVLDLEPARALLQGSIEAAGVAPLDLEELDIIIGIVSRNPMCLKLAARLVRDEGVDKLKTSRTEFLSRLRAEKIQAFLYGRILRHIHADDARRVAYPGLIVRRITPDVIREVLAGPCRIKLTPERDEHAIFQELSKEVALLDWDRVDGSLRHRPDVRRAMLVDLTDEVDANLAGRIDRAAVAFYKDRSGPVDRAEEIYHRLRLHQMPETLEGRWLPAAGAYLKGAGEEVGARERLWLADKLGVTLSAAIRKEASQEEWEEQAARSVSRYLSAGVPEKALEVLRERSVRLPRSSLFALEADTNRFLGRDDEAILVARRGVESAGRAGAVDMTIELLLQIAAVEEGRGNLAAAAAVVQEARALTRNTSSDLLVLRTLVTAIRVHRQLQPEAVSERAALRSEAILLLTDDMVRKLRGFPTLLRESAAELGKDHAGLAGAAIDTLGVEVASDEQASALGRAIDALNKASPTSAGAGTNIVHGAEAFEQAQFDPAVVRDWATRRMTRRDTTELGGSVAGSAPRTDVLDGFRDYFRAGVSNSLNRLRNRKEG
jgi:hypothetical protein